MTNVIIAVILICSIIFIWRYLSKIFLKKEGHSPCDACPLAGKCKLNHKTNKLKEVNIMKRMMVFALLLTLFFSFNLKAEESKNGSPLLPEREEAEMAKQQSKENFIKISDGLSLSISAGASGGAIVANNVGENLKRNYLGKFVVTNLLFDLTLQNEKVPLSLNIGLGGTGTPSILDNPEDILPPFDIEYADFTYSPVKHFTLEFGLLAPSAGYEDTYTFNNKNITVGIIASQQPYNASGIRGNFSAGNFQIFSGFYRERLDSEEYCVGTLCPSSSYEFGIAGEMVGIEFTLYHYHINNLRNLTGIVVEKDLGSTYLALNADYWKWSKKISEKKSASSVGVAFYLSKKIGDNFELPVRLEYISQGKSGIYIESEDVSAIFGATLTPTYNFSEKFYMRCEGAYVYAAKGFLDNKGNIKNDKMEISFESGVRF